MDAERAERLLKAKIPCPETGIEIKKTVCDICCPSWHCGLDAYVKDGVLLKVEGDRENPMSGGHICAKGAANKEYIYRKDRVMTPLRRVGPRGEGKFEPISWDEAYAEIVRNLEQVRERYGPESVLFMAGYDKWYRPFLHRFAYYFGSPNFASDCCCCQTATHLAWYATTGCLGRADIANANILMGWSLNPYFSNPPLVKTLQERKEAGMRIVVIDPRVTPTVTHLADVHLMLNPGTDGALALGLGKLLIDNNWIDHEYIDRYVYGFDQYAEYVRQFDVDRVFRITGVKGDDLYKAAEIYGTNGPVAMTESASPITHHSNGFQNYRAMIALQGITGNYDRLGGTVPDHYSWNHTMSGFSTREAEFTWGYVPEGRPKMGVDDFPLWGNRNYHECQAIKLAEWLEGKHAYPIKMIFGMGMNHRMFPESDRLAADLKDKPDFFVNTELFMTDTCRYADIVLPVCSSFERENFTARAGYIYLSEQAIPKLGQSRSDLDVLVDLSRLLKTKDTLMQKGYDACLDYIIEGTGVTVEELRKTRRPLPAQNLETYVPRQFSEAGFATPSGKFEISSVQIEELSPDLGYASIPTWSPAGAGMDAEQYPFIMDSGSRLPNTLHSRLHKVPSLRAMRPRPVAEINWEDARRLGIKKDDEIELYNDYGAIRLLALPTRTVAPGSVQTCHGYSEADVNELVPISTVDPYTGFPAFKSTRVNIRKVEGGT
ncbi:formate dehydrogenase [Oscillospiraceae bacterium]|nr:formate dehydrogenase [Oscillospiraceae bacterium]